MRTVVAMTGEQEALILELLASGDEEAASDFYIQLKHKHQREREEQMGQQHGTPQPEQQKQEQHQRAERYEDNSQVRTRKKDNHHLEKDEERRRRMNSHGEVEEPNEEEDTTVAFGIDNDEADFFDDGDADANKDEKDRHIDALLAAQLMLEEQRLAEETALSEDYIRRLMDAEAASEAAAGMERQRRKRAQGKKKVGLVSFLGGSGGGRSESGMSSPMCSSPVSGGGDSFSSTYTSPTSSAQASEGVSFRDVILRNGGNIGTATVNNGGQGGREAECDGRDGGEKINNNKKEKTKRPQEHQNNTDNSTQKKLKQGHQKTKAKNVVTKHSTASAGFWDDATATAAARSLPGHDIDDDDEDEEEDESEEEDPSDDEENDHHHHHHHHHSTAPGAVATVSSTISSPPPASTTTSSSSSSASGTSSGKKFCSDYELVVRGTKYIESLLDRYLLDYDRINKQLGSSGGHGNKSKANKKVHQGSLLLTDKVSFACYPQQQQQPQRQQNNPPPAPRPRQSLSDDTQRKMKQLVAIRNLLVHHNDVNDLDDIVFDGHTSHCSPPRGTGLAGGGTTSTTTHYYLNNKHGDGGGGGSRGGGGIRGSVKYRQLFVSVLRDLRQHGVPINIQLPGGIL